MGRWPASRLPVLPVCLALVQLLVPCSAQFAVIGPQEPILARVGEDVMLPCHLSPKRSADTMELMWERQSPRQVVHTYALGEEHTPAAEYRGRTSAFREDITEGKAALLIHNVRASDSGNYLCYFQEGDVYNQAEVELKVAALGSDPHVEMKGYEDGGIRLECTSAGWSPRPQIEWRDARGQSLPAKTESVAADSQGLYTAAASVNVEGGSGQVSCVIRNALLSQEKSARLSIAGPFFWSAQSWVVTLPVTLLTLLVLLATTGYFLWRQQKEKKILREENQRERAEKEAAQTKLQREQRRTERLQDELSWAKDRYGPRGDPSEDYAEWKMALFQPADVFLDPNTAHPTLLVSEDQRNLQREDTQQNLPDRPERFDWHYCVLGRESFTSGRHFWEVNVGNINGWRIGVCRKDVQRKGWVKMTPENGFWSIGLSDRNIYRALTNPRIILKNVKPLERVGVFLDYGTGEVSFYDAIDGTHIYTFQNICFSLPVMPVFRIVTLAPTPLTICPAPGPGPPRETSGAPNSAGEKEDPQAEETSLLPGGQPEAEGVLNRKTSQQGNTYLRHTK